MADYKKQLAFIAECKDPEKLKVLIDNARKLSASDKGASAVAIEAFRKLISIVPSERPGTLEHDFWQTINAFEYELYVERGKNSPLSRTRQKVKRVGIEQTLRDWALSKTSTRGFRMLVERGMVELTGEAIVLRHPARFDDAVLESARRRLIEVGVDVENLRTDKSS